MRATSQAPFGIRAALWALQATAKSRGRVPEVYIVDPPAEHGRLWGRVCAPSATRCAPSRHARPRGSRRPGRSLWVPSAWLRPWWTLRSPFRRRPVLTGRWGPPNAPKPSFLHSMMTHVGWCSGFGLSEHPYGCLGLVVKDLGPLEHFLKKPFFGPPIFYLFSAKSCHRPRPMPGFDC